LYNLAVCYDHIGKYDCAINTFELCIGLKPEMPEAYIGSALSLLKVGKHQSSLEMLDKAVKLLEDSISMERQ
jgi:tetratricopeptide (TPR) repeat protein